MGPPTYSAYKDSGVDWIGSLPTSWNLAQLKRHFEIIGGSTPKSGVESNWNGPIPWATPSDLSRMSSRTISDTKRTISEEGLQSCGTTLVPAGSIILSTRAPIGSLAIAERELCTNQGCKSLVPTHGLSSTFAAYVLEICKEALNVLGKGTTFLELAADELAQFVIPLASEVEQEKITTFLDAETAKIDALVAEQRRLIELLKEKRQAVISHAVTKGLNPDAPMKPSGIEWLGDVPEHWDRAALSRIASRVVVGIAEAATYAYVDEGIPMLRSTNIRPGQIRGEILFVDESYAEDRDSKRINAGDLVTVRTGNAGATALIPEELDGCQCFTMLITSLRTGYDPSYFAYYMNSSYAKFYFTVEGWGTAQVNISVPILKSLPVPIPPAIEQSRIVAHLHSETGQIDALIADTNRAIYLLQERRTALISAAVTGKIDVRNYQPDQAA